MSKARWFRRIVAALAVVAGVAACGQKNAAPLAADAPPLATAVIQPAGAPLERIVDGTVEAVNQATVSAQTAGRVAEILYDVNDVVPAGAVIVRLKGTEQRATLAAAQASVTEARARNAEAAASYQRIADMYARRVVSKSQFDQATANRDAAAARLAASEAGSTSAREGVGYTEVRAPYGGVVTKRLVEVGEAVSPGTPLMTGLSLKDLRVNTYVPEAVLAQVRALNRAAVYVGGQRIDATRITIFPEAATASGTFRARIDVPAGTLNAAPGIYVRVGLVIGETRRMTIPASALVEQSEVTGVYVVDEHNGVSLRYVRPGHRTGDQIEIQAGLSPGERIALDPVSASARVNSMGSRP